MLALESANALENGPAAGRLSDRLHAHLAPLLGDAGVKLLFVRSALLVQREFAELATVSTTDRSMKLRQALTSRDAPITVESAELLFATFIALVSGLIGERLTLQLLNTAWPTGEATTPKDNDK